MRLQTYILFLAYARVLLQKYNYPYIYTNKNILDKCEK